MPGKRAQRRMGIVPFPAEEDIHGRIAMFGPTVDRHVGFRQQRNPRDTLPFTEMMKMEPNDRRSRAFRCFPQGSFDQRRIIQHRTSIKIGQEMPAIITCRGRHIRLSNEWPSRERADSAAAIP